MPYDFFEKENLGWMLLHEKQSSVDQEYDGSHKEPH
jgi:hypothetical protein